MKNEDFGLTRNIIILNIITFVPITLSSDQTHTDQTAQKSLSSLPPIGTQQCLDKAGEICQPDQESLSCIG